MTNSEAGKPTAYDRLRALIDIDGDADLDQIVDALEKRLRQKTRRVRLKCVPESPCRASDGEPGEIVEIDSEKMIVIAVKTSNHAMLRGGEALQEISDIVERLSGKPVLALNLAPGEQFEIWEEQ